MISDHTFVPRPATDLRIISGAQRCAHTNCAGTEAEHAERDATPFFYDLDTRPHWALTDDKYADLPARFTR